MTYSAALTGPGVVRRTYVGTIEVHVPLIGGRAEKTVLEDMTKSFDVAAACTQAWLDAGNGRAAQGQSK